MSISNGNPPIGYGFGLPHEDPDDPEERRDPAQRDAQDRFGALDRELPNTPLTPEEKVQEIVVREQGVNSFAHAEETDTMESPPSVRDQQSGTSGNVITDAFREAVDTVAHPDDEERRRT